MVEQTSTESRALWGTRIVAGLSAVGVLWGLLMGTSSSLQTVTGWVILACAIGVLLINEYQFYRKHHPQH